ncbi:ferruginol synthase [Phtheirospermum japonicum]|uniref:Ferruginol synthase n=1 Tax=Phtheirospermum japonicum TaxID=374723 RepID=A0A830BDU2_9LAMI|nr:ferruginol synthase [Phtheirospermum japonicum]
MEFLTKFSLLFLFLLAFLYLLRSTRWYKKTAKLPPGPFPLPIIGNIHKLGPNPHHSLAKLSQVYGPLMHLKLGSIQAIKHDKVFSGRVVPHAGQALDHHKFPLTWLPAESKWRKFRKLCKEQMFTTHKLEASQGLRQEKLKQLRDYLYECCTNGRAANIGEAAFTTSLNLVSATLFSLDFACFDSNSAQEVLGTPNLADYFPLLKFIDPQRLNRGAEVYFGKLLAKIDEIIDQRLESRRKSNSPSRKHDLLEVLLDLNQESDSELCRNDMKHLLGELMVAGTDTTSDTVHWAMTELMRNPEKLSKLKDELRTVLGNDKQAQESDISRLPYLNAVIKETFRYHPAGPFLVPHKALDNVEIHGYMIPKDAQVLVNVWAIGRDSEIWSNPDSFEPERFLDSKLDYRGQNFELIIFGSGRRICPGLPLAHVMVHLMVACFVHNFDWKLENGMKPDDVDVKELFGLALHKVVPLKALPIKR